MKSTITPKSATTTPPPVNPHDFAYIINEKDICHKSSSSSSSNKNNDKSSNSVKTSSDKSSNSSDPFLLTFVHTAPDHFDARLAIRNTWGNITVFPSTRIIFMMGTTTNQAVMKKLKNESERFHDIVQEDFHDSYRNLTYKAIAGLKWVTQNCAKAKFVLKVDDDIFVNTFSLLRHLRNLDKYGATKEKLILCHVWYKMQVIRDTNSKWHVPKEDYRPDFYPTYCSGSAFILGMDLVETMFNISFDTQFFWVDDVYISGMLAGKAGANYQKFNSVYVIASNQVMSRFTGPKAETTIFAHVVKRKETIASCLKSSRYIFPK